MILSYAQVAHELVHATDKTKLLEASQLIQHVVDLDHRDELAVIYKTRSKEFNPPGGDHGMSGMWMQRNTSIRR